MKRLYPLLFFFCSLNVNAQDILISFSGTGASNTVSSVEIENLTSGLTLTINGTDILRLTSTVGIYDIGKENSSGLKIYPNPMTEKSTLLITAPQAGDATISVYDISGKVVTQIRSYLEPGIQEFTLSGLLNGIYIINVKSNAYQFSGKLISNSKSNIAPDITMTGDNIPVDKKVSEIKAKGVKVIEDMEYDPGDRLKFTGISGDNSTVITDIPSEDKPIVFPFMSCTDGDGNNYPVVTIGTQVWMGENLKTTKYNDGTEIPLEIDDMTWTNLSSPAYCWYNNDATSNKDVYGALYNSYAMITGKLCPAGWHIPENSEWTTLSDYLGSSAGGKMKEPFTVHWAATNIATNESGYTALPGGMRSMGGFFSEIRGAAYWWSSTPMPPFEHWSRSIFNWDVSLFAGPSYDTNGLSVRCLKD